MILFSINISAPFPVLGGRKTPFPVLGDEKTPFPVSPKGERLKRESFSIKYFSFSYSFPPRGRRRGKAGLGV